MVIYSSLVAMWRPMRSRHDIVEESLEIPGSPKCASESGRHRQSRCRRNWNSGALSISPPPCSGGRCRAPISSWRRTVRRWGHVPIALRSLAFRQAERSSRAPTLKWLWWAIVGDDGPLGLMLALCFAQSGRFLEPFCELRIGSGPRGRWFESTRPDHSNH